MYPYKPEEASALTARQTGGKRKIQQIVCVRFDPNESLLIRRLASLSQSTSAEVVRAIFTQYVKQNKLQQKLAITGSKPEALAPQSQQEN